MNVKPKDKIRIIRRDISGIRCPYGVVTRTDGFLVYVRPVWCRYEIELYQNEVTPAENIWDSEKQKSNIVVKYSKRGLK